MIETKSAGKARALEFVAAPLKMYVDGEWLESSSGRTFADRDPGDGSEIAAVAEGGAEDIDRAVKAAGKAFQNGDWATMQPNDRAVILHRLADLIDEHRETLCWLESLDVGKPFAQADGFDVPHTANTFRYYADLAVNLRRAEPIALSKIEARSVRFACGPCGFIIPWNFPFLLLGWGVAPALAAGNTVVGKPAEDTPLTSLYFCKLAEEAGIPKGVVNVVPGFGDQAGAALAGHPGIRRMSFTGSPEVGRLVAEACGRNLVPVKLELGGKGAAVVCEDADVSATAEALAGAITLNSGQVCCTATRWLVHESVWGELVDRSKQALESVSIGHGSDSSTQMGPVVSEKQRQRILDYLEKGSSQGAGTLLKAEKRAVEGHENGYYVSPGLLNGGPDNVCFKEEIFGPVAYLTPYRDEKEAIELVNRSPYGLANSVWSRDLGRADRIAERLIAGNSWINAHNVFAHGLPYGGVNLSGYGGGVLGPETLLDYMRSQTVARPL